MRWLVVGLVACSGGDAPEDEAFDCAGGGTGALELGTGGMDSFVAFQNGDSVPIEQDGTGRYGLYIDVSTMGLDTSTPLTALLRYTFGDETTTNDVAATLTMQCTDPGPAWFGVFAPLDDSLQDAAAVADLDGLALHLTGAVTDQSEETATTELDLVAASP